MSSAPTRICDASGAITVALSSACTNTKASKLSPIDDYYAAAESMTVLGDQKSLATNPQLGRLLLLGHVSAVETYFRSMLVTLLDICEECRKHAGSQVLPLSSVYYYASREIPYGLFDGVSLAGATEFKKAVTKACGYQVKDGSILATTLRKFDELCHLRHAAVHSQGVISSAGALALGMRTTSQRVEVNIDFIKAQEVAHICRATVQEANQFFFEETARRWFATGTLTGSYTQDRTAFGRLFRSMRSAQDASSAALKPADVYRSLPRVRQGQAARSA